jgi:hypothetical protein
LKNKICALMAVIAAMFAAATFAPAATLADPVVGNSCELDIGTGELVAGTLVLDPNTGDLVCVTADGRSPWERSSWGLVYDAAKRTFSRA